jgi:hypothetical protein
VIDRKTYKIFIFSPRFVTARSYKGNWKGRIKKHAAISYVSSGERGAWKTFIDDNPRQFYKTEELPGPKLQRILFRYNECYGSFIERQRIKAAIIIQSAFRGMKARKAAQIWKANRAAEQTKVASLSGNRKRRTLCAENFVKEKRVKQ